MTSATIIMLGKIATFSLSAEAPNIAPRFSRSLASRSPDLFVVPVYAATEIKWAAPFSDIDSALLPLTILILKEAAYKDCRVLIIMKQRTNQKDTYSGGRTFPAA